MLVAVALLVVGLAGGLFGFYDLALPGRWQTRLHRAGDRLQGGKVLEVGLLGALSALVVSACVAPALVASLAFLAETGSAARGALALFVMGFGMGTPLLVLGTTEGRWLPRSGPWMELVKQLLGVGLLAVAASLVARVASPLTSRALELAVWGVLAAVLWRAARPAGRLPRWRAVAIVLVVLAAAIRGLKAPEVAPTDRIATVAAFDATLAAARAAQRPVLVVVGADWCASCHAMDREVYAHPSVRPVLAGLAVVRLDVTEPTDDVRRLEHRLGLVGPPTALFLDRDGRERRDLRLTGEAPRATVLAHLAALAGRGVSRPSG